MQECEGILRPVGKLDHQQLLRTFVVRSSEGFVENFGPILIARISKEAPGVQLRFVPKPDKDSAPLREGAVDLETGVVEQTTSPELRVQALFKDRYVGVVRRGHPLTKGRITPARYAAGGHIGVARDPNNDPIDAALAAMELTRKRVISLVAGFSTALSLARASDLIATVPERHTGNLRAGMHSFTVPVPTPQFWVSMIWHPRLDADAGHRWLRELVRQTCAV